MVGGVKDQVLSRRVPALALCTRFNLWMDVPGMDITTSSWRIFFFSNFFFDLPDP